MAYLPAGIAQSPDEDDPLKKQDAGAQAQAPTLSGGGSSAPAPTQGASPSGPKSSGQTPGMGVSQAPQSSAMTPQGSGYVNLQSFLSPTVAKQQQGQIKGMGADSRTAGKTAFGAVDSGVNSNIDNNTAITATDAQRDTMFAGLSAPPPTATPGAVHENNDLTPGGLISNSINQKFQGPADDSAWDSGSNSDMIRAHDLGDATTALNAAHPDLVDNVGYGAGNRSLDQALLQGDAGTVGAMGDNKTGFDDLQKYIGDTSDATAKRGADKSATIDAARDSERAGWQKYGQNLISNATEQAKQANIKNGNIYAQWQDPEWAKAHLANGQTVTGIDAGSGPATADDFLSSGQGQGLTALSSMLGDSSLAAKGGHQFKQAHEIIGGTAKEPALLAPPPSVLDDSDTYKRNANGAWTNGKDTFDDTWHLDLGGTNADPYPIGWTNTLTGEQKKVGPLYAADTKGRDAANADTMGWNIGNALTGGLLSGFAVESDKNKKNKYNPDGTLTASGEQQELKRRRAQNKNAAQVTPGDTSKKHVVLKGVQ